ncbi:PTS fructose transporter subunit IIC, partial [Escherichia coli]|nr:PTS fructose transporter subunit IIC [Escherichia coli]
MAIKKKVINSSGASTTGGNNVGKSTPSSPTQSKGNGKWKEISKHIMTGISYMIPVLVMGGLIGALSQLIPYAILGLDPSVGIVDAMN